MMNSMSVTNSLVGDVREIVRHVPGVMWLAPQRTGRDDVSVSGFSFRPNSSTLRTSNHAVIVHRQAGSEMRRRMPDDEQTLRLGNGDISLKNFSSEGEWEWRDAIDVLHIHIHPSFLDRVASEVHGPTIGRFRLKDRTKLRDPQILQIAHELVQESVSGRCGAHAMVRALGLQLAIHLVRHHADERPAAPCGGLKEYQSQCISRYVAANLSGDLSVPALASLLNLSADHFTRRFRLTFACTPHQYVLRARLDHACMLLRDSGRPMADIAALTGFSDQSHFNRWFKREFGKTPGIWRRAPAQAGTRA